MYGERAGNIGSQLATQAVRENTQLEVHLNALQTIQDELGKVFARAMGIADRLQGGEPPSIGKADASPKDPAQPPLLRRLEITGMQISDIVQSVHHQLDRLERL